MENEINTYWVCYDVLPYTYERTFVRAKSAQEAVDIVAAEKKARNVEIKNIQVFKRELPEGTDSKYFWTPSAPKEEDK